LTRLRIFTDLRSLWRYLGDIDWFAHQTGLQNPSAKGMAISSFGEMAEWFKAAVLKTAVGVTPP
jgi:hypothetical protein